MKKRILVLCTGNSCRSQMAEGILKHLAGDKFEVMSAGTIPSHVHPLAIKVTAEIGIDISKHRSKSVLDFLGQEFNYVITVCDSAKQSCPVFPGKSVKIHWSFEDPAAAVGSEEEKLKFFRAVRDKIRFKIEGFLKEIS
jgi:arsenate reductase